MDKKQLYESIMQSVAKQVKKAVNESYDGWNEDDLYEVKEILSKCYDVKYEIENCVRGSMTGCKTNKELAKYLKSIGEQLIEQANYLKNMPDDFGEEDEE